MGNKDAVCDGKDEVKFGDLASLEAKLCTLKASLDMCKCTGNSNEYECTATGKGHCAKSETCDSWPTDGAIKIGEWSELCKNNDRENKEFAARRKDCFHSYQEKYNPHWLTPRPPAAKSRAGVLAESYCMSDRDYVHNREKYRGGEHHDFFPLPGRQYRRNDAGKTLDDAGKVCDGAAECYASDACERTNTCTESDTWQYLKNLNT